MAEYFIYALIDPRNGNPFYVGKTKHPDKRLTEHILGSTRSLYINLDAKRNLIREILAAKMHPQMRILDKCDENYADELETKWYFELRLQGEILFNSPNLHGEKPFPIEKTGFLAVNVRYFTVWDCAFKTKQPVTRIRYFIKTGIIPAMKISKYLYLIEKADFKKFTSSFK